MAEKKQGLFSIVSKYSVEGINWQLGRIFGGRLEIFMASAVAPKKKGEELLILHLYYRKYHLFI